mmetsp:Transcript_2584/g.7038  ORF Transcript_2584/g.7038 Transcript_2584/m.7038 type:complete len:215 (+) Transcript_2584:844-1488(+)
MLMRYCCANALGDSCGSKARTALHNVLILANAWPSHFSPTRRARLSARFHTSHHTQHQVPPSSAVVCVSSRLLRPKPSSSPLRISPHPRPVDAVISEPTRRTSAPRDDAAHHRTSLDSRTNPPPHSIHHRISRSAGCLQTCTAIPPTASSGCPPSHPRFALAFRVFFTRNDVTAAAATPLLRRRSLRLVATVHMLRSAFSYFTHGPLPGISLPG